MPIKPAVCALLLALCCAACSGAGDGSAAGQPGAVPGGEIQAANLAESLRVLASDAFEGRAPNTPGEEKTVQYIAERFGQAGLQPAGDDGGWFQRVELERSQIAGPVRA
nr:hypothetical protein [Pseudoxanthomonas sp.]